MFSYLNACRLGVNGDPSLIWPKLKEFAPLSRQVSNRFLGGSIGSVFSLVLEGSSSSSKAGFLRFLSNSKK